MWLQDLTFRRLLQNVAWLASGNSVAAVLGIIATAFKTRALGPAQFGLFAVILAYVALIQQLATFQSWQALIKYGAEALREERNDKFMSQVKFSVLLDVVGAVTGLAIAIGGAYILSSLKVWTPDASRMAAVSSLSILSIISNAPIGILRLLDRFDLIVAQNVLISLLAAVGAIVVYVARAGIWGFLIVTVICTMLGTLLLVLMAVMALRKRDLVHGWDSPIGEWRPAMRFSAWTYAAATLDIPVQQLDIIIVSAVVSLEAAGIYKIIKQVVSLLAMLADPIYQAIYPQFANMIANDAREAAAKYAFRIGALLLAATGPVAVLVGVTSFWWLGAIFGEGFAAGAIALCLFLFFKVFSIGAITVHPLFTAMGFVRESTHILFLADILYLGLAWQLGHMLGLSGMALAYGVQFSTVAGLKVFYIDRKRLESADAAGR